MNTKITPELRQVLIAALVDGEVGLKELGCTLLTLNGIQATEREKELWNEYVSLSDDQKRLIREGLAVGYIDLSIIPGA